MFPHFTGVTPKDGARVTVQQTRVPRGTPTGGRFAQTERPEPTLDLAGDDAGPFARAGDDLAAVDQDPARLLAAARGAVDRWAEAKAASARVPVRLIRETDKDDLANDALVDALRYRAAGAKPLTQGWVSQLAHNAVVGALRGDINPVDSKARKILTDQVEAREQALGRHLTRAEVDSAAAAIREAWADHRHRPSVGFHRNALTMEIVSDQVPEVPDAGVQGTYAPGSAMARALELADDAGNRKQARLAAWDAIAESTGAPRAMRAHSVRQATTIRGLVSAAGGVRAVLDQWESGEDTPATRALMVPFGDLDAHGEQAVVSMLRSRPAYAEELWDSAASIPRN